MSSSVLAAALFVGVLAGQAEAGEAEVEEETAGPAFSVLPGESRVISHGLSASRDTAIMAYQVLPRVVMTTGGDFAFFGLSVSGLDLRAGMFGMFEVQTTQGRPLSFFNVPAGPYLWRGLLGYSLALAPLDLSERLLGKNGALEVALSYRHESEHFTGQRYGNGPMFEDVPNIGDFVMPDLAARIPGGPLDVELRTQIKLFLPSGTHAYSVGPGLDATLRWRASSRVHPFLSLFGEYVVGRTVEWAGAERRIPDNRMARALLGIIVVGEVADIQLYLAGAAGNDKGLLAFKEGFRIGWGMRVGLFKDRPRATSRQSE